MVGGDKESLEWKEDDWTSESAGEWIELEFMIVLDSQVWYCTVGIIVDCDCFCLLLFHYEDMMWATTPRSYNIYLCSIGVRVASCDSI